MTNCHKESIKTLVVLHGQRKAARIAGLTVEHTPPNLSPILRTQSPAAIVADELAQTKARSTLALSRYTASAAEKAAAHKDPLEISRKVKDVSDVHKAL
jgi:hypothetical protein